MNYNWKRFWCPTTGEFRFANNGFLADPDAEYGHIFNPDVVPAGKLAAVGCLALLGEPGIGKSWTLQSQSQVLAQPVVDAGGRVLTLDLKSFGDEGRLECKLLGNEQMKLWQQGGYPLALFLDSLDECRMRINHVAAFLIEMLEELPVGRLYLRIACRTADWPSSFETDLRKLWGDDVVKTYELLPLRRVDVVEAATANELDPEAFLKELSRVDVVPLAIKPITLNFLIKKYQRSGLLPATQSELYEDGCRLLCEETNQRRRDAGLTGKLSSEQRLAVACRIAAVTVLAKRAAIRIDLAYGDDIGEDVPLRSLSGGTEVADGKDFEMDEAAVEETLRISGLFTSRGPNRLGFAHQTYAEFLAARYVVEHKMTLPQIQSLVVHPTDPGRKIVPQLQETCAWIAGMRPDVFQTVLNTDPQVLLRSDVARADVEDRAALVDNLIRLFDEERLFDRGIRSLYAKLAHPGLARQVQPYVRDKNQRPLVRCVAIDIAEACELRELADDLVAVALDVTNDIRIRIDAADAVVRLGSAAARNALEPLARGAAGDDPEDQLKGCGLRAIWPDHVLLDELLPLLTPPKNQRLYGFYKYFLLSAFTEHLTLLDLPPVLNWLHTAPVSLLLQDPFDQVVGEIFCLAWEQLETPAVREGLVRFLHDALTKDYNALLGDKVHEIIAGDDARRRDVLTHLVPLLPLSDDQDHYSKLIHGQNAFVLKNDFEWMIDKVKDEADPVEQQKWLILVSDVYDRNDPEHMSKLFQAVNSNVIFAERFGCMFRAVKLDSPEAEEQRRCHNEAEQRREERAQRFPVADPPPHERVATKLAEFEAGDLNAWWYLMTLEPDSTHYSDELGPDLIKLPGWQNADEHTRPRIVAAAKTYVLRKDPETHKWLGTNQFYRTDLAAYYALRLLSQEAPQAFADLPSSVWKKWAPVVLAYPAFDYDAGGAEAQHAMIAAAYEHVPQEILDTLNVLIDQGNENNDRMTSFIIGQMKHCWDERLKVALLAKAKAPELKPAFMGYLLNELLAHDVPEAKAYAESLVPVPLPINEKDRQKAQVAATALLCYAKDAGWSTVWPAIESDTSFGRAVIAVIAEFASDFDRQRKGAFSSLTNDQLADVYSWIVRHFSKGREPYIPNGFVSTEAQVIEYRDTITGHLKQSGACDQIRRLVQELPEMPGLKWVLLEAEDIARRDSWVPPQPDKIIELAADQQKRFVQNGDQLLEAIIESLERMKGKLQGDTPLAYRLWNEETNGQKKRVWPKDENRFSDEVKAHLAEDLVSRGVIVNREVVIRDSTGGAPGERLDIVVDAVVKSPGSEVLNRVTVVIESKGCWNPKLNEAMETQLVNRYLNENRCHHGLYLVGWFNCEQWDEKDSRKAPSISITDARAKFSEQAERLSRNGKHIRAFVMNTALR